MDSPDRRDDEDVLHDCDFLLQLAEEAMTERMVAKGHVEAPQPSLAATLLMNKPALKSLPSNQPLPTRPTYTSAVPKTAGKDNAFYVEPKSGLKVSRPVIGSVIVRERLSDRLFIKLANMKQVLCEVGADWVTLAVLASKSQQEARNGGFYSRWQLSDLDGASVTVFLFGQAHKELYMLEQGSVIMLDNVKVSKDKQGGGVSLSVEKPEQITRVGHSPDFGFCKGTKADGNACRQVVNMGRCEYCPYHAAQALKQLQSHRPDLRGRSLLEQQLRPHALKADPWQRMDLETRQPTRPGTMQNGQRLNTNSTSVSALGGTVKRTGATTGTGAASLSQGRHVSVSRSQQHTQEQPSDVELSDGEEENHSREGQSGAGGISSAKARLLAAVTVQRSMNASASTTTTAVPARTTAPTQQVPIPYDRPMGPMGLQSTSSQQNVAVNRLPTVAIGPRSGVVTSVSGANNSGHAKPSAGAVAKSKEQSKMLANLGLGKRAAPGSSTSIANAGKNSSNASLNGGSARPGAGGRGAAAVAALKGPAPGPTSAMAAAFGAVLQRSQASAPDGNELQSRYHDLHEEGTWDEIQDMLEGLEKKDALVQQMESVKVLKVSAFQCADCNVFTEYRRKECKDHQVTRVITNKRFWLCGHCNARVTSLGVIYPKKRCPKCNDPGMDFKPSSMYSGPQGTKPAMQGTGLASRENMLSRGTEQGRFL